MSFKSYRLVQVLVVLCALLLSGCASFPGYSKEERLDRRIEAYYAALMARDYATAYEFLTPGYRAKQGIAGHYASFPPIVRYENAKLVKKECATENACRVTIMATFVFTADMKEVKGVRTSSTIPERWVYIDDEWWMLPPI